MWPIPSLEREFVSISFSAENLTCCWIQRINAAAAPLVIRAYKRYKLTNLELYNLVPFNPTQIKKYINLFLTTHNLHDAFIIFCFDGLTEQYSTLPTSTPARADFNIKNSTSVQWEYRYLYPHDDGQYMFYVYIVPRTLLLQYKLLAIATACNVITMTTMTAAILDAYKNIFGVAFRKSQLAIDMMRCDNNIKNLISIDAIRRMVVVPAGINLSEEKSFIAAACGLFYGEVKNEKN